MPKKRKPPPRGPLESPPAGEGRRLVWRTEPCRQKDQSSTVNISISELHLKSANQDYKKNLLSEDRLIRRDEFFSYLLLKSFLGTSTLSLCPQTVGVLEVQVENRCWRTRQSFTINTSTELSNQLFAQVQWTEGLIGAAQLNWTPPCCSSQQLHSYYTSSFLLL